MSTSDLSNTSIENIWIESEIVGRIKGGEPVVDDNSDVIVTFSDGRRFVATLFTYENILTLAAKNRGTGECLGGKYFWASDMLLVDRLDRATITEVVHELIREGEFTQIFKLCAAEM